MTAAAVRVPARELLLHPIPLAAIALLLANDHWLKAAHPGWLTGKLSDVAGMTFFPLLALVFLDAAARCIRRDLPRSPATVVGPALATAAAFAAIKAFAPATEAFRWSLGLLQWPLQALASLLHGASVHGPMPVQAVTDPTDLLALPFVALAAAVAWRRGFAGTCFGETGKDVCVRAATTTEADG
jgi:hypothetical protein